MDLFIVPLSFMVGAVAATCLIFLNFAGPIMEMQKECRSKYSVYECRVMAVPVTPDGQPLDMSDPFHGEDE